MDRYQVAVRRLRAVLADIPEIDAKTYKLKVGGDGAAAPKELTLDDLKNAGVRSGGRQSVFRHRRARKTRQALRLQTSELIFNPAGYHNNVMQNITLNA
jgi:hypothetical protein